MPKPHCLEGKNSKITKKKEKQESITEKTEIDLSLKYLGFFRV
jgi:hypothetical protein